MLAAWSPGSLLVLGIVLIAIGAGVYGVVRVRRFEPDVTPETVAAPAVAAPVDAAPAVHEIAWPRLIDPAAGPLDAAARRRVIDGLAIVGAPWCAEILAAAFSEEDGPLRESVIDGIGRCHGEVVPTLDRALASHRIAERYAAVDVASRRGEVALLERGLRDGDETVALAAAYGLVRANRRDVLDAIIAAGDAGRADEIRRVIAVLA